MSVALQVIQALASMHWKAAEAQAHHSNFVALVGKQRTAQCRIASRKFAKFAGTRWQEAWHRVAREVVR